MNSRRCNLRMTLSGPGRAGMIFVGFRVRRFHLRLLTVLPFGQQNVSRGRSMLHRFFTPISGALKLSTSREEATQPAGGFSASFSFRRFGACPRAPGHAAGGLDTSRGPESPWHQKAGRKPDFPR